MTGPGTGVRWLLASFVLLVGACASGDAPSVEGDRAPTFASFDLDGNEVRLADHRGKPVLVNFWASWCIPCRREFPLIADLLDRRPDVVVLGVIFDDDAASARAFMRERGAEWTAVTDPDGDIASAYGVGRRPGIPVTVAVTADGAIARRHVGEFTEDTLDELVEAASGA